MVKNIIVWNGLSGSDKAELDKILNAVYMKAVLAGYNDVYKYLTESLDGAELINMLDDFGVKFAKREGDVILNDEDYCQNIREIALYISNKISESDFVKVDFDKIDEIDDNDFETFLSGISNSLYDKGITFENVLKEFLSDNSTRKQFVKFCIEKLEKAKLWR